MCNFYFRFRYSLQARKFYLTCYFLEYNKSEEAFRRRRYLRQFGVLKEKWGCTLINILEETCEFGKSKCETHTKSHPALLNVAITTFTFLIEERFDHYIKDSLFSFISLNIRSSIIDFLFFRRQYREWKRNIHIYIYMQVSHPIS